MDDNIIPGESDLRPYEKCEAFGPESLTDAELIAVVIKTGSRGRSAVELSEEILYGGDNEKGLVRLISTSPEELTCHKGIGRVKCIQLSCIFELSKRLAREHARLGLEADSPKSVSDFYMAELTSRSEEEVHLMLLNTKNRLIKSVMVSRGTVNTSAVSPREIFIIALKYKAAAVILVHNHPSGDPAPSKEDIRFTSELYKLGRLMNIPLRDSIIIGNGIYMSFLEKGMLFIDE